MTPAQIACDHPLNWVERPDAQEGRTTYQTADVLLRCASCELERHMSAETYVRAFSWKEPTIPGKKGARDE